jgi:hypothetical protein
MTEPRSYADLSDAEREEIADVVRLTDEMTTKILAADMPSVYEYIALRGLVARLVATGLFIIPDRTREALYRLPPLADLVAWRKGEPG